jgi:mannose-6-phosphate isomerase
MSALYRLENRIQNYAWGSHSALAAIRSAAGPSEKPEAELWMGAHPLAPSRIVDATGDRSLLDLIDADPKGVLGDRVASSFGRLPFLMKLLAAREPLSLQAHPSEAQAKEGYAREEAAGIPRDSPTRSYRDPSHKPELIVALTPFSALVGFRTPTDTGRLFASLGVRPLAPAVTALTQRAPDEALRALFGLVTGSSPALRRELADATFAACRQLSGTPSEFSKELAWGAVIGELFPGDPGIVLALALNLVVLEPGQALYLPAGNLHAYLAGTGVELMASSDNVLRGGLTPKHVDVTELLRVLDFDSGPAKLVPTEQRGGEIHYLTPATEFALSRCSLGPQRVLLDSPKGPEIIVVTEGSVSVHRGTQTLTLPAGASVFVPAAGDAYELSGAGTVFRARVNL